MRLKDKVALITGAATGIEGQLMGFGGATAWRFVREGARVVLTDIDVERGEETSHQIRDEGHHALFLRLDVTSEQDWITAVKTTVETFGKLDVLVNNAGTSGGLRTVVETTEDEWHEQMEVHAKGAFLGTKHALPAMQRAGGGSIINISSINALIGSRTTTAYDAAKAAMRQLTKSTAIQFAKQGIRANSVHPGYATTPMTEVLFQSANLESRLARVPMGRLANADDVAWGILYLASNESAFVTGSELVIDGGMTAQ